MILLVHYIISYIPRTALFTDLLTLSSPQKSSHMAIVHKSISTADL